MDAQSGRPFQGRQFCVIGAGVAGLALARRIALSGGAVMVLEARKVGGGASGASAGVLKPPRGGKSLISRLSLGAHSGYDRYARDLETETGIALEFRRCGYVDAATETAAESELRKGLSSLLSHGISAQWLEADALRRLVPDISRNARGALFLPGAAWIHPPALMESLRRSCLALGVDIQEGCAARIATATDLQDAGRWHVEATGIGGRDLEGRETIVAAGAWTGTVLAPAGLAPAAPIQPIRGQMAEVGFSGAMGPIVHHRDVYVIPRPGGTAWVGSTVEDVGFDETVIPERVLALVEGAREILPGLGAIRRSWAGLRPKLLRRGGPLIGEGEPPVLAGHYRSGIQWGPITAHILAARIAGDPALVEPFAFSGPG